MSMSKNYKEFETASGTNLKIFAVPDALLSSIIPKRAKPVRPKVEMEVGAKKQIQERWAKAGDPEYDAYKDDLDTWEQERDVLRDKARIVLALREHKYPDPLEIPAYMHELISDGLMIPPETSIEIKFLHINDEVLNDIEIQQVTFDIMELSGMPPEAIDQMKQSFQRVLHGETIDELGTDDSEDRVTE